MSRQYAVEDPLQQELRHTAQAEGLPAIHVSPALGRLLSLLVGISGARRILAISEGTRERLEEVRAWQHADATPIT